MAPPASRPASELTAADFAHSPVWRYRLESEGEEGVDESHVLPAVDGLRLGIHGSFMVRAKYLMSDGQELSGAVQVDILDRKVISTPVLLYVEGKALDPLAADVATRVARIIKRSQCRPTRWTLAANFADELAPRSGHIARSPVLQAAGLLVQLFRLRMTPRGKG